MHCGVGPLAILLLWVACITVIEVVAEIAAEVLAELAAGRLGYCSRI
jgi:hypothetical protein